MRKAERDRARDLLAASVSQAGREFFAAICAQLDAIEAENATMRASEGLPPRSEFPTAWLVKPWEERARARHADLLLVEEKLSRWLGLLSDKTKRGKYDIRREMEDLLDHISGVVAKISKGE